MENPALYLVFYEWLQPFLKIAKDRGLPVTPDTHIQLVQVLKEYADKITDGNLLDFISPVLVKNTEQLKILKDVYRDYQVNSFPTQTFQQIKQPPPSRKYLFVTIAALLVLLVILYFVLKPGVIVTTISITHDGNPHSPVLFQAMNNGIDTLTDTQHIRYRWNFGDGTTDSGSYRVQHLYKQKGSYAVSLNLESVSQKIKILNPDTVQQFSICGLPFQVFADPAGDIETGQSVQFTVHYDSLDPPAKENEWHINDSVARKNSFTFTHAFLQPGKQVISFYPASEHTSNNDCQVWASTEIMVKVPDNISLKISQSEAKLIPPDVTIRSGWLWVLGLLTTLPIIIWYRQRRQLARKQEQSLSKANAIVDEFNGQAGPFTIPFSNHDKLIEDEKAMLEVIRNYKRRSTGEVIYLDIPQTINSTIRSEGIIDAIWSSKTKPVEYLMLIDKNKVKSQQVKLFGYLLGKFARNDLYLEKFYFLFEPDICNNERYPNGIHLSRLHDLYPNHVVILFGSGYQLIDKEYPTLNDPLIQLFKKWDTWAVCTPVNFADWGFKEKILQKATVLLPADLEGMLLLFRLQANKRITYEEYISQENIYHSRISGLDNVNELETYLNDPFLFQWVCAIAVYPRIQWDVLVSIGEALQRERYRDHDINYSSLLKIVRISWMHEGSFPDNTRLELLKWLEPANEKIARETMIRLLDEALQKMDKTSFAYEDLQMQRITDRFLLYANDPDNNKYKEYSTDFDKFKSLWEQEKVLDLPLRTYLQKDGKKDSWSTLIKNQALSGNADAGTPMDTFFEDGMHVLKKKFFRAQRVLFSASAVPFVMLIAILTTGKLLGGSAINNFFGFVSREKEIPVKFHFSFGNCPGLQNDATAKLVLHLRGETRELSGIDTALLLNIPYSIARDSSVRVTLSGKSFQDATDTNFRITGRDISFGVRGCPLPATGCNNWVRYDKQLEDRFAGDWYDDDLLDASHTFYLPVHVEPGYINGKEITQILQCNGETGNRKIILKNDDNTYQVLYMQNGAGANTMKFAFANTSFKSAVAATNDTSRPFLQNRILLLSSDNTYGGSMDTIKSYKGSWTASQDAAKIELGDNNITFNNQDWGVSKIEEMPGNQSMRLFRIATERGRIPQKFFLLPLAKNKILFSEAINTEKAGVLKNTASIGTLKVYNLVGNNGNLPSSLSEIWKGGTSNRLLTINLNKKIIYYSTGDKKTFGTYPVDDIRLTTSGVYKVITRANSQFQVFLLKNVQPASFEFSVCQNRYNTKEEALAIDETYCDRFNTMTYYYEVNQNRVYLPVSGRNLAASEAVKVRRVADSVAMLKKQNRQLAIRTAINENETYLPPITESVLLRYFPDNGLNYDLGNDDWLKMQAPNPFDRNYISISTLASPVIQGGIPAINNLPDEPCNRMFYSLKEALSVDTSKVCRLDLSKENLYALPKEIFLFRNLKELILGETDITATEISNLQRRLPNCKISYTLKYLPQQQQSQQQQAQQQQQQVRPSTADTTFRQLRTVYFDSPGKLSNSDRTYLNTIIKFLTENPGAAIRLVAYYRNVYDQKDVAANVGAIKQYIFQSKQAPALSQVEERILSMKSGSAGIIQRNSDNTVFRFAAFKEANGERPYVIIYGRGFSSEQKKY